MQVNNFDAGVLIIIISFILLLFLSDYGYNAFSKVFRDEFEGNFNGMDGLIRKISMVEHEIVSIVMSDKLNLLSL